MGLLHHLSFGQPVYVAQQQPLAAAQQAVAVRQVTSALVVPPQAHCWQQGQPVAPWRFD